MLAQHHNDSLAGRSLPPPPVAIPVLPEAAALLQMRWSQSVWNTYQGLLQTADQLSAANYLALQWRLDFDAAYQRSVRLPIERNNSREKQATVVTALASVLHPYQTPLGAEDLRTELMRYGLEWLDLRPLRRALVTLQGQELARQFPNPFKGGRILYCHSLHRSEPAAGDQVVELIRRSSHRSGVVVRFKVYRPTGQQVPVVLWDAVEQTAKTRGRGAFESFGNPEMMFVVGRSEPFRESAHAS